MSRCRPSIPRLAHRPHRSRLAAALLCQTLACGAAAAQTAGAASAAPEPGPVPDSALGFASPEHAFLGSQVRLRFADGSVQRGDHAMLLRVRDGAGAQHELSYAELAYLSGDFYGVPYAGVAQGPDFDVLEDPPGPAQAAAGQRFVRNLLSLRYSGHADFLPRLRSIEEEQQQRWQQAREHDYPFPGTLDDHCAMIRATGGDACPREPADLWKLHSYLGLYVELATRSDDHFGDAAQRTFLLGQKLALHEALHARGPDDLRFAYLLQAYAAHFGGDAFAAGHIRTPKKALHEFCAPQFERFAVRGFPALLLSGALAKFMHDLDNRSGVYVTARNGLPWMAYGDDSLSRRVGDETIAHAVELLQTAADQLHHAYAHRHELDPQTYTRQSLRQLRQLLPDIDATLADREHNTAPIFERHGDTLIWNDGEHPGRDLDCLDALRQYAGELASGVPADAAQAPPAAAARSVDVLIQAPTRMPGKLACDWSRIDHGDFPRSEGSFTQPWVARLESNGLGTGVEGDLYCLLASEDLHDIDCEFSVHFDNPYWGADSYRITRHSGTCRPEVDVNSYGDHWQPRIRVH